MHWYFEVLKNYANFRGRARRREYWIFALINSLIFSAFYIFYYVKLASGSASFSPIMLVLGLYGLLIIIPSWAVVVRRLHDTGRSGWWIFITFVPLVGSSYCCLYC